MNQPISYLNFDIISTIRYDDILLSSEENTRINLHNLYARPPLRFYMLRYHHERMVAAGTAFGWDTSQINGPVGYDRLVHLLCKHLDEKFHGQIYIEPLMV